MRQRKGALLYSASDLVSFLGCSHATFLDIRQLIKPVALRSQDEQATLLQEKGVAHERAYLGLLEARGLHVVRLDETGPLEERAALTRQAMAEGADVIYQGALLDPPWHGFSDFLLRVDDGVSNFGPFWYEVADTKLARSAKPKHVVQLCVYSALVGREQGIIPRTMRLLLGDSREISLKVLDFLYYHQIARERFKSFVDLPPAVSTGEPCGHCEQCRWAERCENEWDVGGHLTLVASMTRGQAKKLREAGIRTIHDLGAVAKDARVTKLPSATLLRLRAQARLQLAKRADGKNRLELLPPSPGRGLARLPAPDAGDLYFDMEGDPLYDDGGLEYLFGFVERESTEEGSFTPFWAHDRLQEKKAFENAVDFITTRLRRCPGAHVYHYAAYEETALKRLAMYHGTREVEIDQVLRARKLVDLYKVVRESVRVSEPAYSIKNLEAFYGEKRAGEVKTAGESIVVYERWRRLGDDALLKEIADYNEFDCRSTLLCHKWLLTLRPEAGLDWFSLASLDTEDKQEERQAAEARTAQLMMALVENACPVDRPSRKLLGHLLEFHRREAKPQWWAMFARQEMSEDELIDDAECIGGLQRDPDRPPYAAKRSTVHTFRFPAQDFKLRVGDTTLRSDSLESAGEIVALDDGGLSIALKLGPTRTPLPDRLSLSPQGPIADKVLREAIYRYAEAVVVGEAARYAAVTAILGRHAPRVAGCSPAAPIIPPGADLLAGSIEALCRLQDSYMLIQGPPGAGKTFTSSHAMVALLKEGQRVGVASNSHKAINNLLSALETVAAEQGVRFRGVKKSSSEDQYLNGTGFIVDTRKNEDVEGGGYQLVAGTAWLFARDTLDQAFDYLFVDEAGQVSLANIVAMGVSARNIVLVGDQMQLAQPIQGTHPGGSGLSALEHLLGDHATVPPERGIFLPTSRRMHPALCRFISDAVYDGRLEPDPVNAHQQLLLNPSADLEALAPSGLRFVAVTHDACAQKSEEEAARLCLTYGALLGQRWRDRHGAEHPLGTDEILVVSPYNMQVNLLRSTLPTGARVGTVDKFQGQEAPIVLISMATSSGDDLPRNIEFLYSRNRLNVAISRARCLAVVFASPRLLEIACTTIHQMRLVNTLCWAKCYADSSAPADHA